MILRNGMIGFAGGNEFIQRAIRFFINSDFSHSFIILDGPDGMLAALETTETLVTVTPMQRKFFEKNWVEIWEINTENLKKQLAYQQTYQKYSGKWYGYLSYLWFMWRWVWRFFGIEKTKMWNWCNDGVTCTELSSSYCKQIFPDLFKNDINTYSPRELREIFKQNREFFTCLGWMIPKDKVCQKN